MNIEEYKRELENWKEEHTNFYNECLHAMKNRKATLGAYMHIYDYAMSELMLSGAKLLRNRDTANRKKGNIE